MALEADTSSYPKSALPVSPLDVAGKLGGLQSQALTIDKQKLDQANQAFGYMARAINSLGPNATKQQIINIGQDMVNHGMVPSQMLGTLVNRIPDDPQQMPGFIDQWKTATAEHKESLEYYGGQHGGMDLGNAIQPTVTRPNYGTGAGQGPRSIGLPIAKQIPITQPVVDENNQSRIQGQQPLTAPQGQTTAPPPLPVGPYPNQLPTNPFMKPGEKVIGTEVLPVQRPSGPATGPMPMFEEGRKQLASDQELATQKLTAIKPALQVLPLLPDIMAGPGTGKFNTAMAALKGFGFIPTDAKNDPTAIRQIVVKKLAQYVSSNPVGQRSDAAQTLAEAGSPNPNVQILPALIKLTKDAVILDRVQAARAGAFEKEIKNKDGSITYENNNDYSKYGQHRSTFPARVDERAFGLDLMEPQERKDLIAEMKKKRDTFEGKKFWNTLRIVDKQGLVNTNE